MKNEKPMLSVDEQILHLKNNGVKFEIMDETEATEYLTNNNNYFKLTAYRKNYPKHPDGIQKDKYINMDFAYLVDMAIIDMQLRYRIVHMALDIEHFVKVSLLNKIWEKGEDGYQVVKDYDASLDNNQKKSFDNEINRNKGNVYCGDIIKKYEGNYPVWALIEIAPFGRLVSIYGFCAERFDDEEMRDDYFRLLTCKEIRNASAHSNCILNDLKANTIQHKANIDVIKALSGIKALNSNFRRNRMSNARIQQIVTLLYMHNKMILSEGIRTEEKNELRKLTERFYKNIDYYSDNPTILGTLCFLKIVIDSWFLNN